MSPAHGALAARLRDRIRRDGPLTVAAFMDAALYDPEGGYYATAPRRSGRAGDFVTSVDTGPMFGAALADFVAAAWAAGWPDAGPFDLVEAAASDGRLMRDVLERLAARWPACHAAARVTLVEASAHARDAQGSTLGAHATRVRSRAALPPGPIDGIIFANELLDAFPVHRLVVTADGVQEAYVGAEEGSGAPAFHLALGAVSSRALAAWFDEVGVAPQPGTVADVSPAAMAWVADAADRLRHGYLLLVDYGHEAARLYGQPGGTGTLRAFSGHAVDLAPRRAPSVPHAAGLRIERRPAWLEAPGTRDLTAHVDFTAIARAAARGGLTALAHSSQSRFLLAFGADALFDAETKSGGVAAIRQRLRSRMLVHPDAMGAAFSVLLFGRGVTTPDPLIP